METQAHPLKRYRRANDLTLFDMAEMVGVSEVSMSRYENGRIPRPEIQRKIAEVTGNVVQPNHLIAAGAPAEKADKPPAKPAKTARRRKRAAA
jgi:transcriptional regulator with XRE-family HTH domain